MDDTTIDKRQEMYLRTQALSEDLYSAVAALKEKDLDPVEWHIVRELRLFHDACPFLSASQVSVLTKYTALVFLTTPGEREPSESLRHLRAYTTLFGQIIAQMDSLRDEENAEWGQPVDTDNLN